MRSLFISDNSNGCVNSYLNQSSISHIDFMLLTDVGDEKKENLHKLVRNGIKIKFLRTPKLIDDSIENVGAVVDSIEENIVRAIQSNNKYIKCFNYGNQKNGYIYTPLSEQNPFKSNYILKLSQLNAISLLLEKHEYDIVFISLEDVLLNDLVLSLLKDKSSITVLLHYSFLKKILHRLKYFIWVIKALLYFLRMIWQSFCSKLLYKNKNRDADLTIVSYFPLLGDDNSNLSTFHNMYFLPLQEYLAKSNRQVRWVLMYIRNNDYGFLSSNKLAKSVINDPYSFIESNLTVQSLFRVAIDYLSTVIRFSFVRGQLINSIDKISALNREEKILSMHYFDQAIYGTTFLSSVSYYYMFKSLSQTFEKNHKVIYLNEMQNWEKAQNIAFQEVNPTLTTIGFQHTSVSRRLFFYTKDRTKVDNVDPMPTHFAVNGSYAYNLLSKTIGNSLIVLEAIRHLQYCNIGDVDKNKKRKILIVGSYDKYETRRMINLAIRAFQNINRGVEILIKQHPSGGVVKKEFIKINNYSSIKVVHGRLSDILEDVKVVIVGSSTSSIDALAHNCSIIIPIFPDVFCVNPLLDESNLVCKVYSSSELCIKTLELLDSQREVKHLILSKDFLSHYWCTDTKLTKWRKLI